MSYRSVLLLTSLSVFTPWLGAASPAQQETQATVETPALTAELDSWGRIGGVAVDRAGSVYVSNFHDALWRIDPDGTTTTLTRALSGSSGIAIDARGDVLQANFFDHTITRVTRDGESTTLVDHGLVAPVGLVVDDDGSIFVCNCGNDTIGRVARDGSVGTFSSGELFACPNGITRDDRGNLYVVSFNNPHIVRIDAEGRPTILATLPPPEAATEGESGAAGGNAHITFARGSLFVTRFHANDVFRVELDGRTSHFAGTGEAGFEDGPASTATFTRPNGIAAAPDGSSLWLNTLAGRWRGDERTTIVLRRLRLRSTERRSSQPAPSARGGPPIESTAIRVGDMTFDALVAGPVDGEPVLLLHGFPETSYAYRHQLRALAAAGYRAVAPDQRGYSRGARPAAIGDYAMTHLVGDVLGIADALGFTDFHLVGHDWGAAVAWVFAARFPGRVQTLTALSTPHVSSFGRALADPEDDQADRSAYFEVFSADDAEQRFLADDSEFLRNILRGLDDEAVDRYVAALGTPEAIGAALNWYRASATRSGSTSGGTSPPVDLSITVPTLYIWGDADTAFGRGAAEGTAEFVRGPYRFEVIEGSGHWLMERATERINELLLEQLSGGWR